MSIRFGSITAAVLLAAAACTQGPAGPDDPALIGQFGRADAPIELLATHAGVTLDLGCGAFFVSEEAAILDEQSFEVDGRYRPGGFVIDGELDASLIGGLDFENFQRVVTVTLLIDRGNPAADPHVRLP